MRYRARIAHRVRNSAVPRRISQRAQAVPLAGRSDRAVIEPLP